MSQFQDLAINEWHQKTLSTDFLIRSDAADNFPDHVNSSEVAQTLIRMLDDDSDLVRTSSAESLSFFRLDEVRSALWRRFEIETSDLVKGYLISSIGEVGDMRDWSSLMELSESSHITRVQTNALVGMQRLCSRFTTMRLRDIVVAQPEDLGTSVTSLLVYLHVFWLRDIPDFVNNVEPVAKEDSQLWIDDLEKLRSVTNQLREFADAG